MQIGKKDKNDTLDHAINHMCRKTKDLRRQLRKAVVDHVSDRYALFMLVIINTGIVPAICI